jgi:hypothetical protein
MPAAICLSRGVAPSSSGGRYAPRSPSKGHVRVRGSVAGAFF